MVRFCGRGCGSFASPRQPTTASMPLGGWRLSAPSSCLPVLTLTSLTGRTCSGIWSEAALSGLLPAPGQPLSRAFASYSGRIIAATGHEELFGLLGYSNEERASARAVWVQEFPRLQLSVKDSSADLAAALKKAYWEFRYRAVQQIENYEFSEQFLAVINSSVELVDTAERGLLNEAISLLTETVTQAKSTARIDVPGVRELDSALHNLSQDVCASGSLLLQETLYPAIRGAGTVLAGKLGVASRVSHPELRAQLVS